MFGITAGYHRYFAHRSYKTTRVFQFVLALGAQSAAQKGVLWWARTTAATTGTPTSPSDIHSPQQRGFWWSHVGWILSARPSTRPTSTAVKRPRQVPRAALAGHAPLVVPPVVALALAFLLLGGLHGAGLGLLRLATSCCGTARSRSTRCPTCSAAAATRPPTTAGTTWSWRCSPGRGLAQQPPPLPGTANQGFYWWEIDMTYYVLRMLAASASCGTCADRRRRRSRRPSVTGRPRPRGWSDCRQTLQQPDSVRGICGLRCEYLRLSNPRLGRGLTGSGASGIDLELPQRHRTSHGRALSVGRVSPQTLAARRPSIDPATGGRSLVACPLQVFSNRSGGISLGRGCSAGSSRFASSCSR